MNLLKFSRRKRNIVAACAILLVSVEILLRVIWGFGNPLLSDKDPDVGYFFTANQKIHRFGNLLQVNQFHQRNRPISDTPDVGVVRILCIGDSVTFGGAIIDQSETFPELLASRLNDGAGTNRYEVLNASAGSWGIGNELAYLKKFGLFHSSTVIFQIGSHDLTQHKSNSSGIGVDPNMPDRRPFLALSELAIRYGMPRLKQAVSKPNTVKPSGLPGTFKSIAEMEQSFATNMIWFSEAVELARESGAMVLVLHTPDRNEVVPGASGLATAYEPYRSRFLQLCDGLNVPVINLPNEWRSVPGAGDWFRDGVHLTPAGNAEVAKDVGEAMALH